jgi:hypothetical protein
VFLQVCSRQFTPVVLFRNPTRDSFVSSYRFTALAAEACPHRQENEMKVTVVFIQIQITSHMIFQRDLLFANFQGTVLVRDACFSNVTFTNGCPNLDLCKKNAFGGFHLGE